MERGATDAHRRRNGTYRVLPTVIHPPRDLQLLRSHLSGPPSLTAASASRCQTCLRSFTDEFSFELSESAEEVEDELATCRPGIDPFAERAEAHLPGVKFGHDVNQMAQASAEPVEPPNNDSVALAKV